MLALAIVSGCGIRDFEVHSVAIEGLDGLGSEEATVTVALGIHNPNPYKVTVIGDHMGLWISGDSIGTISFGQGITLPAKEAEQVAMSAKLDMQRVNAALNKNLLGIFIQGLEIGVEGTVTGKAWGTQRTIEVHHTERISLVQ
jgi:LEA14-like dessication related protein